MLRHIVKRWRQFIADTAPVKPEPVERRSFRVTDEAVSAAGRSPSTMVARKLRAPELPPGVIPAQDSQERATDMMAMDDATMAPVWGWANMMAGFGCGLYFPGYPYLAELFQRSEYRAPSETMAKEMTRKWIKLKSTGEGDKSAKLERMNADIKQFGLQKIFRDAALWSRAFGRAQVYINIKDQDDKRNVPLVIDKATIKQGSLLGFKVIEPMWTTPVTWNSIDPTRDDFYKPTMWYVLGRQTHATRLMTFIPHDVPDLLKPSYNFGGISDTQLVEPYVNRWLRTCDGVNQLINNFSKMVLLTDMSSVLAGGNGEDVLRRLQMAVQTGNNQGFFAANKESEDLKNVAVPLSGLHELQAQSQEHMSMPTHIPLVKLTGITPSGLNASSDGEIQVFYDYVHADQESDFTTHMDKSLDLIQLNAFGEIDPDITYEYVELTEPDGEALARQRKTDAEAGVGYIDAGVISPEEERERLASDPTSGYDNLSGPPPEPPEDPALVPGEGDGGDQ